MKYVVGLIVWLFSTAAVAQMYIPLQPSSQGHWDSVGNVGEGMSLLLRPTDQGHDIFVNLYTVMDGTPFFASAGGDWSTSFVPYDPSYLLDAYIRDELNTPAFRIGRVVLTPTSTTKLHVLYVDDFGNRIDNVFTKVNKADATYGGFCNATGFGPHPPLAPEDWCHGESPE